MPNRTNAELVAEITRLTDALTTERARPTMAELERRLLVYNAMLDTVPIGVVMADHQGRIIYGNSHVEEMLRHPVQFSDDYDSYHQWTSFHADGRQVESHEYPLARILRDGETQAELVVNYQRGDGTMMWMRIIGREIVDETGERIGATVALVDMQNQKELEQTQQLLIRELNHRVKNAFAVVQSIIAQSARKSELPEDVTNALIGRVGAYATAHARLLGIRDERIGLAGVVSDTVTPIAGERLITNGPAVALPEKAMTLMALVFYELATNATKYGALAVPGGTVTVSWDIIDGELHIDWVERGGPMVVAPTRKGFGSTIIDRALTAETGGRVQLDYAPAGFEWHFVMNWNNSND